MNHWSKVQPPHFGNQGRGWLHQSAPTTPCAPPRRAQSEREETANRPGTGLVTMARSCLQQDWLQQASAWGLASQVEVCTPLSTGKAATACLQATFKQHCMVAVARYQPQAYRRCRVDV